MTGTYRIALLALLLHGGCTTYVENPQPLPVPLALGPGVAVDPIAPTRYPVAIYMRQQFAAQEADNLPTHTRITQVGTHATFPVTLLGPPVATNVVPDEFVVEVSTADLPRDSVFIIHVLDHFTAATPNNSSRPPSAVRLENAEETTAAVFTTGACPHVTWIGGTPGGGGVHSLRYGVSEEIRETELQPGRYTFTYGGQRIQPAHIRSGVMDDVRLGHFLEFEFDPPLQPNQRDYVFTLSSDIVSVSGARLAGNFAEDLSCAPADFIHGGGGAALTLAEPPTDSFSYFVSSAISQALQGTK